MDKALLFGATGNLGREIAGELKKQGYGITAVARSEALAKSLAGTVDEYVIADVMRDGSLRGVCDGFAIIISALGKSVSPKDRSKPSFRDVDYAANSRILKEAIKGGVRKFIYVSAFQAGEYPHLEYFRAHHDFAEELIRSGVDYVIVEPPALFSAFLDMFDLAAKGRLMTLGDGLRRTNPIYEGDLAAVCVAAIKESRKTIAAGGREIFTRRQLAQIVQSHVNPGKKVRRVPLGLVRALLPLTRAFDRNTYDKFAFFIQVMAEDTIAPQVGETRFEDYIGMKAGKCNFPSCFGRNRAR